MATLFVNVPVARRFLMNFSMFFPMHRKDSINHLPIEGSYREMSKAVEKFEWGKP